MSQILGVNCALTNNKKSKDDKDAFPKNKFKSNSIQIYNTDVSKKSLLNQLYELLFNTLCDNQKFIWLITEIYSDISGNYKVKNSSTKDDIKGILKTFIYY